MRLTHTEKILVQYLLQRKRKLHIKKSTPCNPGVRSVIIEAGRGRDLLEAILPKEKAGFLKEPTIP